MVFKSVLRSDSVVLVTGGGRGVTARCAVEAARTAKCTMILAGRTNLDTPEPDWAGQGQSVDEMKSSLVQYLQKSGQSMKPVEMNRAINEITARREIQSTLDAIHEAGGKAAYLRMDAADQNSVSQAARYISEKFGRITGLIHGAGALADKRIENKSLADFRLVYGTKVKGLENLISQFPTSQMDFVVLFSSVVSVSGNPGQADYAAANRTLDAYAWQLQAANPACRVLSINWGPWESGMVSPALKAYFESHGVNLISLDDGAQEFIHLLSGPESSSESQIIVGSPPPRANWEPAQSNQRIQRTLRRSLNPFLNDHQIGGNGVLPATCAAAWLAHTADQVYPGMRTGRIEEFKVLKGLVFSNDDPQVYASEIQPVNTSPQEVIVDMNVTGQNGGKLPLFHYKARITLFKDPPQAPQIEPPALGEEPGLDGASLYADGTCFHGPAFMGLQKIVSLDDSGLLARVHLPQVPAGVQGQFPTRFFNPYLNDVIVQTLLVWTQKRLQAPCLPSYARLVEQYGTLEFDSDYLVRLVIESVNDTAVVGNLTVWNTDGVVVLQIRGLQGTISTSLKRLIPAKEALHA